MSEGITEQIAELTEEARASGHKSPLRHAYASPPPGAVWGDAEWGKYWDLYEKAQGLEGCAYAEQIHDKGGDHDRPAHKHRVYLALTERGTLVRDGWSFAKQEAVSRIMEADTGAAFVKGAHNIRAATIATQLGRNDVATAMAAAGLLDGTRARAALSPRDRLIQERTQVSKADVARGTAAAWAASEGGASLTEALETHGLRLAWGDKKNVPVVLDRAGTVHGLAQMLRMAARETGTKAPKEQAIAVRLDGMAVPPVADVRREIRAEGNEPAVAVIDEAAPIPAAPIEAQDTPVAVNDLATPAAAETVAKTETAAPAQTTTGMAKKRPPHQRAAAVSLHP